MSSTHTSCTHRPHPHFNQSWSCSPNAPLQKSQIHSEIHSDDSCMFICIWDIHVRIISHRICALEVEHTGSFAGRPRLFLVVGLVAGASGTSVAESSATRFEADAALEGTGSLFFFAGRPHPFLASGFLVAAA